jgi:hypothetical protein
MTAISNERMKWPVCPMMSEKEKKTCMLLQLNNHGSEIVLNTRLVAAANSKTLPALIHGSATSQQNVGSINSRIEKD